MKKEFLIEGTDGLAAVADFLLPLLKKNQILALVGQIGAGKTTLTKMICLGLGVVGNTSSPTFAIINEYQSDSLAVYHIDLYRLKSEEEAFDIGLMELLEGQNYAIIEWPELVEDYLPAQTVWAKIEVLALNKRKIVIYYV